MSNPDSPGTKQTGKVQAAGIGIMMSKAKAPATVAPAPKDSEGKKEMGLFASTALFAVVLGLVIALVALWKMADAQPTYDELAHANGLDSSQEFSVALNQDGVLTGYAANTLVIWEDRRGGTVAAALILPGGRIIPSILISKSMIVMMQAQGGTTHARFQIVDSDLPFYKPNRTSSIHAIIQNGLQELTITGDPAMIDRIMEVTR